jgi:hypothetical protein
VGSCEVGRGFTGIFKLDIVHKSSLQNEGDERGETTGYLQGSPSLRSRSGA